MEWVRRCAYFLYCTLHIYRLHITLTLYIVNNWDPLEKNQWVTVFYTIISVEQEYSWKVGKNKYDMCDTKKFGIAIDFVCVKYR